MYRGLKQIYPQTISRGKYQGYEFDVTIPEERVCIEYSPTYWHEGKEERDLKKMELCKEHNVRLIYIQEDSYNELEHKFTPDYICYKASYNSIERDKQLVEILDYILSTLNHSISEINIEKAKEDAFNFMHNIEVKEETEEAACI